MSWRERSSAGCAGPEDGDEMRGATLAYDWSASRQSATAPPPRDRSDFPSPSNIAASAKLESPLASPDLQNNSEVKRTRVLVEDVETGAYTVRYLDNVLADPATTVGMRVIQYHEPTSIVDMIAGGAAQQRFVATFDGLASQGGKPLIEIVQHVIQHNSSWDGVILDASMQPKPLRDVICTPPSQGSSEHAPLAARSAADNPDRASSGEHGAAAAEGSPRKKRAERGECDSSSTWDRIRPPKRAKTGPIIGFFSVKQGKGATAAFAPNCQLASFYRTGHVDEKGRKFASSHQQFFVLKAETVPGSEAIVTRILKERNPADMKRLTYAPNLDFTQAQRSVWEASKIPAMRKAVHDKFKVPEMRAALLATGDAYLEERNGNEKLDVHLGLRVAFWGSGSWGAGGNGLNWNGHILMDERDAIRAEERGRSSTV